MGLHTRLRDQARHPRPQARPARARAVRALRHRPGVRPQPCRLAERQGRAHRPRPPVRQGHRPRDALQHRLRRLRLRAARQDPRDQGPTRGDHHRRAVRPGTRGPLVAYPRRQARPSIRGVPTAKALVLRALRRPYARHSRLARRNPPLPVLDPPPPRRLPAGDRQGRAIGGAAHRLAARLPTRR
jgi:hypothetical protein